MRKSLHALILAGIVIFGVGLYCYLTQHENTTKNYRPVQWEDLLPESTLPKIIDAVDLSQLKDSDPKAMDMLKQLRNEMDKALPVTALDGESIRIAGYLVPLEYNEKKLISEFLLVPYYGACIHTPPPPANQIIHVFMNQDPGHHFLQLDAVEVAGEMEVHLSESNMGRSHYRMWADTLTASKPPEPTTP